ncbi:hypothetical protein HanXRQr2_Chr06g0256941 [Helianthus annuus]|uniref:Uncharacterized protein n=1 Tax=Helianthus annuus TaxID=4232 RepID=A0A9K3ISC1_HELAN|nr:hypothetical protein HanXRQr2_Chr06g0256941 [Helianthus annuus]KAJ0915269.1 hypothetical protein HanPSC8_Chr06g0247951 [Helianthus annuus]
MVIPMCLLNIWLLGYVKDNRFGKQLLKEFKILLKTLKNAIDSIRRKQRIIDQRKYILFMLQYVFFLLVGCDEVNHVILTCFSFCHI